MAKFCDLNVPLPANGDCYHCFVFLPDRNVFVVVYNKSLYQLRVCVVVQFYPWFKFYFPLFWCMIMYDNEFETKEHEM